MSLTSAGQPRNSACLGRVGIAAPGENIASVGNSGDGALVNGSSDAHQKLVVFAAPATRPAMLRGGRAGPQPLPRAERYRGGAPPRTAAPESLQHVGAGNRRGGGPDLGNCPPNPGGAAPAKPMPIRRSRARLKDRHRATPVAEAAACRSGSQPRSSRYAPTKGAHRMNLILLDPAGAGSRWC